MLKSSIDIGSNSVLLLVAEIDEKTGAIQKEVANESYITSLGKDLDINRKFITSSMEATKEALRAYAAILKQFKLPPSTTIVTATEAARVAQNSKIFFDEIKEELGFNVQVITSEAEARYTAQGVVSALGKNEQRAVIMDIGGASTELIKVKFNPFEIESSISLPVGSVRAKDWVDQGVFEEKLAVLLADDLSLYETKKLICVAGSMTSLASVYLGKKEFDATAIEGMSIALNSFKDFTRDLNNTTVENLLLLFPFLGKRAVMVGAGARVAVLLAEKLKIDSIEISTRGLRYGTVAVSALDRKDLA